MVHYKLFYFNSRGRAEPIRYVLTQANADWEDCRIDKDDWAKMQPSTPMQQLPVLYVDNKALSQSMTIARYVAKENGLLPTDNWLAAKADMLVDGVGDCFTNLLPYVMAIVQGHVAEAPKHWDLFKKEHLPRFLDLYEKLLVENGAEYFVGNKLSWADLIIAEFVDRLVSTNTDNSILHGHKHLLDHMKRIHDLPNIKKYVAKRAHTLI